MGGGRRAAGLDGWANRSAELDAAQRMPNFEARFAVDWNRQAAKPVLFVTSKCGENIEFKQLLERAESGAPQARAQVSLCYFNGDRPKRDEFNKLMAGTA
jgi:hypothetical protein